MMKSLNSMELLRLIFKITEDRKIIINLKDGSFNLVLQ